MVRGVTVMSFMLMVVQSVRADVIHVPADYPTIQEAINAAVNGDTVLVSPGTYAENINFRGRNIVVASEFLLDRNPETIVATVINGGTPAHTDTGSCVIINSGEDTTAVLEGFTLTGGIGTKWVDEHGAGTYVEGGGVLIQYSSPVIRHNRIVGNFAIRVYSNAISGGGGGIRVGDGVPRILNNVIMDNEGLYGGGIVLNYTGGIVKNNVIANNRVYAAAGSAPTFGGGGIWTIEDFGSNLKVIENNTIYGNSVGGFLGGFSGRGGGILIEGTSAIVRSNIIWGNTQLGGGQIWDGAVGTPLVTFTDVEGGYAGDGNIDIDPFLADSSFYLLPGSPCVDAGDSSLSFNDPEDPMNLGSAVWPALGTIRNDMGAYGGPGSMNLGSFPVTSVELPPGQTIPDRFSVSGSYPNPFNPSTTLEIHLPQSEFVRIVVYDLLGREVTTLVEEVLPAGVHRQEWNAAGSPSGIYFFKVTAGPTTAVRKAVLAR